MGLKQFYPYIDGRHVDVFTAHSALTWLLKQKQKEGRIARWIISLQQYDMTISHRPGKKMGNADALSRQHEHDTISINVITRGTKGTHSHVALPTRPAPLPTRPNVRPIVSAAATVADSSTDVRLPSGARSPPVRTVVG